MKKAMIALSLLALVFTSCKKDDAPKQITPTHDNVTGSYKVTGATWAGVNVFNNTNGNNIYEACQTDDVYEIKADNTYQIHDQGTQCNPVGDESGDWALNGSALNIGGEITGTITSWDGSTMVVSDNSGGAGNEIVVTLKKQ
jgi:Lipocalin-like domain